MNADTLHLSYFIAEKLPVAGVILALGYVFRHQFRAWAICRLTPPGQSKGQAAARIEMLRVLTAKAPKSSRRSPPDDQTL